MASLREELNGLLIKILPADPNKAIIGTDLIQQIVKNKPDLASYPETSMRQTLSSMVNDPTSCIARIVGKQGYYLRNEILITKDETNKNNKEELGRNTQKEEKFRSIFMQYEYLNNNMYTKHIEHTKAIKTIAGLNIWKFPDVVMVDWKDVKESNDEGNILDSDMLEIRKSLGDQPFQMISNELKIEANHNNFREYLFQCVSNSMWAHKAQLVFACAINDLKLETELSRLGTSYDVTIISYGISNNELDKLPNAKEILLMKPEEFEEKIQKFINITPICKTNGKNRIDWEQVKDLKYQNNEFNELFNWISKCLKDGKTYLYNDYQTLKKITKCK